MRSTFHWLLFAGAMAVQTVAMIAGWFVLIPFCLARAWTPCHSDFVPQRVIDCWSWEPLNWIYGQPEDGVSGLRAIVHGGAYMPGANAAWRAYCWSALRNSCDMLKYVFAWRGAGPAPFVQVRYTIRGRAQDLHMGWQLENGHYVPVLALW
jgi:hypothetical protein